MNKQDYQTRLSILRSIREFFDSKDFLEVETPILAKAVIPEPTIDLMTTCFQNSAGKQNLHLLPSPEYHMKQLLADGWGNMFQFSRCFRNTEAISPLHSFEFTMLEYYWVEHNYWDSMMLTEELLHSLNSAHTNHEALCFRKISMEEAFHEHTGLSLAELCGEGSYPEDSDISALQSACTKLGISFNQTDNWEVLFNRIFLSRVEPQVSSKEDNELVFLYDYPAKLQSLSAKKEPWTERWELYWRGVELANCYTEENNYKHLSTYIEHESKNMHAMNSAVQVDYDFADRIQNMPDCTGTALGIDRLVMILSDKTSIHDSMLFACENQSASVGKP